MPPHQENYTSACPLDCPDSCSLQVKVTDGTVTSVDGDHRNPLTDGVICRKVREFGRRVHGAERLLQPLVRQPESPKGDPAGLRPASWDEALDIVTARIQEVRARAGGEAILPVSFGGSNGLLTEGAMDRRLFRRLGASRLRRTLCAAPAGAANQGLYGKMPGMALTDFAHAQLVVAWGVNPSASGIHLLPPIQKAQDAGGKLVVVDPRRTRLARRADLHLALRPGTDLPLALCVIRHLFEEDHADLKFIEAHTDGAEMLYERASIWSASRTARTCGVPERDIVRFAELYAESSPAALRCGYGLERNRNGGSAVAAVLALPAVAGKFCVRGGGFNLSTSSAWLLDDPVHAAPADTRVIDINRLGRALTGDLRPPIEVAFVYDCNPLATVPEQNRVRRGLRREGLFTVVFDQVVTDTALYADVILPATTFLEHHELRKAYGAYVMQRSAPVVPPVGEARPNYEVFAELIRRLGLHRDSDPETPDELVDEILVDLPDERSALEKDGIAFPPFGTAPVQFVDVFPRTFDGRVNLFPPSLEMQAPRGLYVYQPDEADERYPLTLVSPALRRQITSTFGELHREIVPATMHPDDAAARDISSGDVVRLFNDLGEVRTTVKISADVRPGVVHLPKGLWAHHTLDGNTANALCPDTLSDLGFGACFNDARIDAQHWGPPPEAVS